MDPYFGEEFNGKGYGVHGVSMPSDEEPADQDSTQAGKLSVMLYLGLETFILFSGKVFIEDSLIGNVILLTNADEKYLLD